MIDRRVLVYILTLFLLGGGILGYQNYKNKQIENSKEDLINVIENTDFIEKNNEKYKINKDKLTSENLTLVKSGRLPRENRISDLYKINKKIAFNDIDLLDQKTLDEQVYVIGNFYLNSSNKENADKYITTLEKNLNENLDNFTQKDNKFLNQTKESNNVFTKLGYLTIVFGGIFLAMFGFKLFRGEVC